jgi:hypothetical protein
MKRKGAALPLADRDIVCAECPWIYSEEEIVGRQGDEERTLSEIFHAGQPSSPPEVDGQQAASSPPPRQKGGRLARLLKGEEALAATGNRSSGTPDVDKAVSSRSASRDERNQTLRENLARLEAWTFFCPKGHVVDGNRGLQLPIGVVGPTGSSKSHFLPGLIWETNSKRVLSPLGISLRAGQFTAAGLDASASAVYVNRRILPPTPPDAVQGPFGYRLSLRDSSERYSLLLFDVGGEALSSIVRIREQAPYVLLSKGLFILIDPRDLLPTHFDESGTERSPRETLVATTNVRNGISRIVDSLEELNDRSIRDLPIPICFVIAKADSIRWTFDWDEETTRVLQGAHGEGADPLEQRLIGSSDRVRAAFAEAGGQLVVEDIDETFDSSRVRFVAASATSEMPESVPNAQGSTGQAPALGSWKEPTPNGTALGLLHLLDMLGVLAIDGSRPAAQ